MKRFIGLAAAAICIIMLASCRGADIAVSGGEPPAREVTIETFGTVSSSEETEEETIGTSLQSQIPPSEAESAEEPAEEFSLPEEFYAEMDRIVEEYGLNPGCDNSEECSCNPEYETYDEEGNVIEARSKTVSVYYKDLKSGFEYKLNPGAHYPIASTVKIPFCTLIWREIDEGIIDPEKVLTYEQRHYFGGTGVIIEGDFGQQFTVRELLGLAITRSDNIAYEMLKDLVSWSDFSAFLTNYGCSHEQDVRQSKQKICVESAAAYAQILAEYLTRGTAGAEQFKEDLSNTRLKMITSSYPMYRKYGWAGFSFHDIAFIDAPRPYVLAILSNLEGESQSDYKLFREISELVEKYTQPEEE